MAIANLAIYKTDLYVTQFLVSANLQSFIGLRKTKALHVKIFELSLSSALLLLQKQTSIQMVQIEMNTRLLSLV